jgi:hypothetical protein
VWSLVGARTNAKGEYTLRGFVIGENAGPLVLQPALMRSWSGKGHPLPTTMPDSPLTGYDFRMSDTGQTLQVIPEKAEE